MNKDLIIAKQKELIKILINHPEPQNLFDSMKEKASISKIQSELSALESEPDKAEERKTAEALLDNHKELFGDRWYFTEYLVSLMELYASQSLPEISDEEIDNKRFTSLGIIGTEDIVNAEIDGFKRGAKWYRDELKRRLK